MIKLSDEAIKAIRKSTKLKAQLQLCLNISGNTLYKRIKLNDVSLTAFAAIDAIRKETGLLDEQIITRTQP